MEKSFVAFSLLVFCACGGGTSANQQSEQTAADSIGLASSQSPILGTQSVTSSDIHKHEADNFYAIYDSDKADTLFFGNGVDDLARAKVIGGVCPVISPDGKNIAYTEVDSEYRTIHLYNIESGLDKTIDFGNHDVYSKSFSPDGQYLALIYFNDNSEWKVLVHHIESGSYLIPVSQKDGDYYEPTFSPDGRYLVFHNSRKVFVLNFNNGDTKLYKSINCEELCQQNDLVVNSDSKFQLTSDGQQIIFNCEDYSAERRNVKRLMCYNIAQGSVSQILGDDYSAQDFQVSSDDNIYFLQGFADYTTRMYMARLSDLKPVRISSRQFGKFSMVSVAY